MKKSNKSSSGKAFIILLVIALLFSTIVKILAVSGNNFAFTIDQGRDLVDVRHMIVTHIPRLVGPTTSINGLLLGPFYYYFLSLPFIIFGGNPASFVYWQILWFQLAAAILFFVFKKNNSVLAYITAILLLLSPVGFYTGRYFWTANTMPVLTILFFSSLFFAFWNKKPKSMIILGLLSGLSLQVEAAFGVIFFPFALLVFLIKKTPFKQILFLASSFLITIVPQAIFELRHGFIMTKTLTAGLSGSSGVLGEKLSMSTRILQRKAVFVGVLRDSNHVYYEYLGIILLVALIFGLYYLIKGKTKVIRDTILLSLAFILFTGIFYLIFPQQVKNWYVLGLTIPVIIFLSASLSAIFERGIRGKIGIWAFILFCFYHVWLAQSDYLNKYALKPSADPSNLSNQLKAIDWVYQKAGGKAFYVYSYLPSVYDYPYQYLFWWYGTNKYGYQPADISYLPNQPEYIKNSDIFWTKKISADKTSPTFLIIEKDSENPERISAWRGNFSKLCRLETTQIVDNLSIEVLSSCPK